MASTRSVSQTMNRSLISRMEFMAGAWAAMTPFGAPVDPDVKITYARSDSALRELLSMNAVRLTSFREGSTLANTWAASGARDSATANRMPQSERTNWTRASGQFGSIGR